MSRRVGHAGFCCRAGILLANMAHRSDLARQAALEVRHLLLRTLLLTAATACI